MIVPGLPKNERERLAELIALKILDTDPEERFDRITRLASKVFDVPIAYIALIDADRQWFKSSCGLSSRSTNRSVSFCGHTILSDVPLVVPDTLLDERFHDNPMVLNDPRIRFYAGHPLQGPAGANIGTLCLAAHEPREAATLRVDEFSELAGIAEHELAMMELIETQRELISTKNELIQTKVRLDTEVRNAAEYVESLIPRELLRGSVRVRTSFTPSSELGGDFIGCVALRDQGVAAYLLDVTGHGVAASLLAVSVGHTIRELLQDSSLARDPGAVLSRVNAAYPMDRTGNRFVTGWLGVIDPGAGTLRYACAGHIPPLLLRGHKVSHITESGPPISVVNGTQYETTCVSVRSGDRVFTYSDGLIEVPVKGGDQLGIRAFESMLVDNYVAEQDLAEVISKVQEMSATLGFNDDVSLMEIAING